jgi:hypothetical protein
MAAGGAWGERMVVETALSLVHRVCRLNYRWHRAAAHAEAHLAYVAALFDTLLALDGPAGDLAIARYSL